MARPAERSGRLQGIQLWVALPDADRRAEPWFTHHADLPIVALGTATARVIMGSYGGATSDADVYTRLMAAEVTIPVGHDVRLPLEPSFEHGILALSGGLTVDGTEVPRGSMMVFDPGRPEAVVTAPAGGRVLLIGGEPFEEELVMWWNFVARSHEEIVKVREDWEAGRVFGEVRGYPGDRLAAPPMPSVRLRPRPRMRPE